MVGGLRARDTHGRTFSDGANRLRQLVLPAARSIGMNAPLCMKSKPPPQPATRTVLTRSSRRRRRKVGVQPSRAAAEVKALLIMF